MGTSDAFGGSGTDAWKKANDAVADEVQLASAGDAGAPLGDLIAKALKRGNATTPSLSDLLGSSRRESNSSSGSGGRSARSPLSAASQAARGSAALVGFDAWRLGDRARAAEVGLDLSRLRGLTDRERCIRIVDDILGPPSHPDDVATRKALLEVLLSAVREEPPPSISELLDRFVEALAWELAVVQIATSLNEKRIARDKARSIEDRVRRYIRNKVTALSGSFVGDSAQAIASRAAAVARRAFDVSGS